MKCQICGERFVRMGRTAVCPDCGADNNFREELVAKAKEGDEQAKTELYTRSVRYVSLIVTSVMGYTDETEDVVQEIFMKIFANLKGMKSPDALFVWIGKIAHYTALDWLKKKKPVLFSEMQPEDAEQLTPESLVLQTQAPEGQPEEELEKKERTQLLQDILSRLPAEQQEVVRLFYYEDRSIADIAEATGAKENTVKGRLRYARINISRIVEDLKNAGTPLLGLAPFPFFLYLLREAHYAGGGSGTAAAPVFGTAGGASGAGGLLHAGTLSPLAKSLLRTAVSLLLTGGTALGITMAVRGNIDRRKQELTETVDFSAAENETLLLTEEAFFSGETSPEEIRTAESTPPQEFVSEERTSEEPPSEKAGSEGNEQPAAASSEAENAASQAPQQEAVPAARAEENAAEQQEAEGPAAEVQNTDETFTDSVLYYVNEDLNYGYNTIFEGWENAAVESITGDYEAAGVSISAEKGASGFDIKAVGSVRKSFSFHVLFRLADGSSHTVNGSINVSDTFEASSEGTVYVGEQLTGYGVGRGPYVGEDLVSTELLSSTTDSLGFSAVCDGTNVNLEGVPTKTGTAEVRILYTDNNGNKTTATHTVIVKEFPEDRILTVSVIHPTIAYDGKDHYLSELVSYDSSIVTVQGDFDVASPLPATPNLHFVVFSVPGRYRFRHNGLLQLTVQIDGLGYNTPITVNPPVQVKTSLPADTVLEDAVINELVSGFDNSRMGWSGVEVWEEENKFGISFTPIEGYAFNTGESAVVYYFTWE